MPEKQKYIRISSRIGFENMDCWVKGYTFIGEYYVSPITGVAQVWELDEFGSGIRVHLAESVEMTFKE